MQACSVYQNQVTVKHFMHQKQRKKRAFMAVYLVKTLHWYHLNSLKTHMNLWKCLAQTDRNNFQDMVSTPYLIIERPLDMHAWFHLGFFFFFFTLVLHFWVFCYDLASLARLDVAETCYPHSLQFIGTFPSSDTILKQPPYLLFNPHLSSHFTTLPPPKASSANWKSQWYECTYFSSIGRSATCAE